MKLRLSNVTGGGLAALGLAGLLLSTTGQQPARDLWRLARGRDGRVVDSGDAAQLRHRRARSARRSTHSSPSMRAARSARLPGGVGFAIGQRSTGHGVWSQKGRRTYRQKFIALINFDTPPNLPGTPRFDPTKPVSPGFFAGWQTVTHTLELVDANQCLVRRHERVLQDRWDRLSDGVLDGRCRAVQVSHTGVWCRPVSGRHRLSFGQGGFQIARVAALAAVLEAAAAAGHVGAVGRQLVLDAGLGRARDPVAID